MHNLPFLMNPNIPNLNMHMQLWDIVHRTHKNNLKDDYCLDFE